MANNSKTHTDKDKGQMENARIIAVAMQKGGTGKTTSTLNLGAALIENEKRVLVIDLDPQANLTCAAGLDSETLSQTVFNAISAVIHRQKLNIRQLIIPTKIGFDLLPSSLDLALAERDLHHAFRREYVLAEIVEPLRDHYDYILVDCSPSLGMLVINALTACDSVLIPVQVEFLAARSVGVLLEQIDEIRETRLNPDLEVEGILLTMSDPRTIMAREIVEITRKQYDSLRVFDQVVHRSVRFPESVAAGESILTFAPNKQGTTAYRQLAKDIITHGSQTRQT